MLNLNPQTLSEKLSRDAQLIIIFLLWSIIVGHFSKDLKFGLVDDAYIPMIYARNLVEGNGLVFYEGGERVEGYSSPLWMVFLTGCELFGIDLPKTAQFLSTSFGFMALLFSVLVYVLYFFPRGDSIPFPWQFLLMFFIVSDVGFIAWTISGMEASLYSILLILLAITIIQKNGSKWIIITLTLITTTRHEGLLISFATFLFLYARIWFRNHYAYDSNKEIAIPHPEIVLNIENPSDESKHKIQSFKIISLDIFKYFLIPVGLLFILRWLYFGYPLPNTFYAKHDFAGWEVWVRGFHYVLTFFIPRPLFLFAVLWVFLEKPRFRVNGLLIWGMILTHTAAVIWEGGDHFALHRFMMPVIPLLAILSMRGIELFIQQYILNRVKITPFFTRSVYHILIVILMIFVVYFHARQLYEYKANDRYHFSNGAQWFRDEVNWARNWIQVGKWLKEKYPPRTKIAVVTAGAIPYFSELPTIDIMGLNDVTIAHTPAKAGAHAYTGHEKSNPDYVLAQEPQWVQLFPLLFFGSQPFPEENLEQLLTYPAQKDLWGHPEFREKYKYTSEETPYGFISYFERRNPDDGP